MENIIIENLAHHAISKMKIFKIVPTLKKQLRTYI